MAGRNQHHIPQFFQKGFGVRTKGKPREIWVYERGVPAHIEQIKKNASDFDFYSQPSADGSKTLDDKITDLEGALALLVQAIRRTPDGGVIDPAHAVETLMHLVPRTMSLRSTFDQSMHKLFNGAMSMFADDANLQRMIGLDEGAPTPFFQEQVGKALAEDPRFAQIGLPAQVIERMGFAFTRENFAEGFLPQVDGFRQVITELLATSETLTRESHNKAIAASIDGDVKRDELLALQWSVEAAPAGGAIMPDCIAFVVQRDGGVHPFMMASRDKLAFVVLPLSTTQLLVGRPAGEALPDLGMANEQAAACSDAAFYAAVGDPGFQGLTALIGTRSTVIVDEVVDEAFEKYLPPKPKPLDGEATAPTAESAGASSAASDQFSYQVSFFDCADQETAERIGASIKVVIQHVSRFFPLRRLDGITFANDYPAAVLTVDRGLEGLAPLETASSDVGEGIARPVLIVRDGVLKTRLVMTAGIAAALTSEDDALSGWALHIFVNQLAHVAFLELTELALPGIVMTPFGKVHDRLLYGYVSAAMEAYVTTRESADFGDSQDILTTYRELAVGALERAQIAIPAARLAYRYDGDMGKLLGVVRPAVSYILQFIAELLGQADALDAEIDPDGRLGSLLEKSGLKKWLTVYRADLRRFYERVGRWASFDEFLAFNQHVERILWQFGMFPWEADGDDSRIEIPVIFDAEALMASDPAFAAAVREALAAAQPEGSS